MKIVVVGLGYVGVTAAACLSAQGHNVIGVDIKGDKVACINRGASPIIEPGVDEMISEAASAGRLSAATSIPELDDVDLVIVCVGTPSAVDGSHNMSHIVDSARQVALAVAESRRKTTVAFRSTFKPGTMTDLIAPIFADTVGPHYTERVELAYNPEFLRETTAVQDYFEPPRIVIGTDGAAHSETMAQLHQGITAPVFETGFREAEITKFVDNSWHAVKVAFANEVGRICAAYGVDAQVAHSLFVADTKLNISPYYTRPGGAFGGSCLPKDVRAMQHIARSAHVEAQLLESLLDTNESHKRFQFERVAAAAPGTRILVVGIAFKPGTDDMRESPHVDLVARLISHGYHVRVYDPEVKMSALIGQNFGSVMSELPHLREILIDADEIVPGDFDLVVINSPRFADLEFNEPVVQLDLRVIV